MTKKRKIRLLNVEPYAAKNFPANKRKKKEGELVQASVSAGNASTLPAEFSLHEVILPTTFSVQLILVLDDYTIVDCITRLAIVHNATVSLIHSIDITIGQKVAAFQHIKGPLVLIVYESFDIHVINVQKGTIVHREQSLAVKRTNGEKKWKFMPRQCSLSNKYLMFTSFYEVGIVEVDMQVVEQWLVLDQPMSTKDKQLVPSLQLFKKIVRFSTKQSITQAQWYRKADDSWHMVIGSDQGIYLYKLQDVIEKKEKQSKAKPYGMFPLEKSDQFYVFQDDKSSLVVTSTEAIINMFHLETGKVGHAFHVDSAGITAFGVCEKQKTILIVQGRPPKQIQYYSLDQGKKQAMTSVIQRMKSVDFVTKVIISPNGNYAAFAVNVNRLYMSSIKLKEE